MAAATTKANKPEGGNARRKVKAGDTQDAPVSTEQRAEAKQRLEEYLSTATPGTVLGLTDRLLIGVRRHAGADGKAREDDLLRALVMEPAHAEDALLAEGQALSAKPGRRKEQLSEGSRLLLHNALEHLEGQTLVEWDRDDKTIHLPKPDLDGLPFTMDVELKNLLPPLAEEELSALEHSLLTTGPGDPIYVWKEKGLLIDGHNRVLILLRHGRREEVKALKVIEESLGDEREAVQDWMEERQGARRNQSRLARMYTIGRRYNREKKQGARTDLTSDQNDGKSWTDERLSEKYGISPATIGRSGRFAASLDKLIETANGIQPGKGEQLRSWLLRRRGRSEPRVTDRLVNGFAELEDPKRKTVVEELLAGRLPEGDKHAGELTVVKLKTNDPKAQAAALETSLGRKGLEKLHKAIDKLLAKPE